MCVCACVCVCTCVCVSICVCAFSSCGAQAQCVLSHFSCVRPFVTPWTIAYQASLSRDSPGKNTGVGCHALLQGLFLTWGSNLHPPVSPVLQADTLSTEPPGKSMLWLRLLSVHLQGRRPGFDPWIGKIPWTWASQFTPIFLPGESHGQRSLVGWKSMGLHRVGHD